MKKRLCLLVAFILVLVMFSGCGKQVSVGNKLENFEKTKGITVSSNPSENMTVSIRLTNGSEKNCGVYFLFI